MEHLVALRRDLHAHPELGFQEQRTSDIVANFLQQLGIEVHRGIGKTGVVGILKKGSSERMIGLRADMDALPMQDQSGTDWQSRAEQVSHACGHDGHTVMLLGAAENWRATSALMAASALSSSPPKRGWRAQRR